MPKGNYAVISEAICDWMKHNAQQYPMKEVISQIVDIPESVNFADCKKLAYKKLEKAGYIT